MSRERFVDRGTQEALDRQHRELLPFWSVYGQPLRVTFPAGGAPRDVAHGLGVIPDGFLVVSADAVIIDAPGRLWTPSLAWLQASTDNAHAIIIFFTLREEPIDA